MQAASLKKTPAFQRNRLLHVMILVYAAFWGMMAVSPTDRMQWMLENILVVLVVIVLSAAYTKLPLSNMSYVLIFLFLCLHTYAAHYTYQQTPFDLWLKSWVPMRRSYFDRIVHFAFGLLWLYPFHEFHTLTAAQKGRFWLFTTPVAVILSLSAMFEIIEMLTAAIAGQIGEQYAGLQGDPFDSEKDMALSFTGAVLASLVLAMIRRRQRLQR